MSVKQTIQLEFTNAPTGTPLASRSVTPQLTSDQSCSVAGVTTGLYPAEEDQREERPERSRKVAVTNVHVFVLDANGAPLVPTTPRKARVLLKAGKAVVVSARPMFIIKLTKHVGGSTQPINMGIDEGYEYIGFALVGVACYLAGQIHLDNGMTQRLTDRRMYRRGRCNKLRYRPARWQNRASSRRSDLPPSVQRRIDRHIKIIEKLLSICPITTVYIEGAKFDIQKLMNPDIQGKGYQEGVLFRSNLRAYLFARENCTCQYCGKKIQHGERVEMHHIVLRSEGGTDKPNNFALLHEKCHRKLHDSGDAKKLKKNKQYKTETFMNTLRKRLFEHFPDAVETFGYVTSAKRKEHFIDAFIIAGGTTQAIPKTLRLAEHRKNNRSLQVQKKGKDRAIRRRSYPIQPGDLVWLVKKQYVSKGCGDLGKRVWIVMDGERKLISVSKITKVFHFGTLGFET